MPFDPNDFVGLRLGYICGTTGGLVEEFGPVYTCPTPLGGEIEWVGDANTTWDETRIFPAGFADIVPQTTYFTPPPLEDCHYVQVVAHVAANPFEAIDADLYAEGCNPDGSATTFYPGTGQVGLTALDADQLRHESTGDPLPTFANVGDPPLHGYFERDAVAYTGDPGNDASSTLFPMEEAADAALSANLVAHGSYVNSSVNYTAYVWYLPAAGGQRLMCVL